MLTSVLIANRGEIACRIIRTARQMGLRTIAVYSDADSNALHVRMADEAHHIGPSEASRSYLDGERIVRVARETGADCVHPGYGFLAENAAFAEACARAGIVFVGPPAKAIRAMGLKDGAKALLEKSGVPVVPGYHGDKQDEAFLKQKAYEVGYPLLIKAVAGGGGKGMRRVERHQDFPDALSACKREAASSFGDDRVLIERFVTSPRHIEIQVFADSHGNCVHLFERDCSLQRRHQKVIEEAPAPGITPEIRAAMGEAAVTAARAVGYVGAGTVEFIADASNGLSAGGFYFMEMNTRLQVEHPVTEMITGIDLVELQLRVAAGEALPFDQEALGAPRGHAVEARLYAEDPGSGFLPQSGRIVRLDWPSQDESLRIDTGVETGAEISPYYDPMVAKLIAWGETRDAALDRLSDALGQAAVLGVRTNLDFLERLARFGPFREGAFDTSLIDTHITKLLSAAEPEEVRALATVAWIDRLKSSTAREQAALTDERASPWAEMNGWTPGMPRRDRLHLVIDGEDAEIEIEWLDGGRAIRLGDDGIRAAVAGRSGGELRTALNGREVVARIAESRESIYLLWQGRHLEIRARDLLAVNEDAAEGGAIVRAPMSGRIVKLMVSEGESIPRGTKIAILEAMKMEHPLSAGLNAVVKSLEATEGAQVAEGDVIAVLEGVEETS